MWNPFRKKMNEGALPLVQWGVSAFSFQSSPGHNYDQWQWAYPAQTNQYTYFNAFYGNQLPSFNKFVPVLYNANVQIQPSWLRQNNTQQQNALQAGAPGSAPLMWGQQPTADYISSISQFWASQSKSKGGRK
jgi:hypothetical protein